MQRKKRPEKHKSIKVDQQKPTTSKKWIWYPIVGVTGAVILGVLIILGLSQNLPSLIELEHASDPMLVTRIYSSDA